MICNQSFISKHFVKDSPCSLHRNLTKQHLGSIFRNIIFQPIKFTFSTEVGLANISKPFSLEVRKLDQISIKLWWVSLLQVRLFSFSLLSMNCSFRTFLDLSFLFNNFQDLPYLGSLTFHELDMKSIFVCCFAILQHGKTFHHLSLKTYIQSLR